MKRVIDILGSAMMLGVLAPVFGIIALIIRLGDGGTPFFSQLRIGKGGEPFTIFKFRSMSVEQATNSAKITASGDDRITPIGSVLRKSKLDELPQLWNILRGDMSFVGPRPEVEKYVELYTDEEKEVLSVRPGLTDFATIEFRNEEKILEGYCDQEKAYIDEILPTKLELSRRYIKEMSFATDMRIILRTIRAIFN